MTAKKNLFYILLIILVLLVTYHSYNYFKQYKRNVEYEQAKEKHRQATSLYYAKSALDFRIRFFSLKNNVKGQNWDTLPEEQSKSVWFHKEKALYQKISKDKSYDILVLPLQEYRPSLDRVTRISSARYIADEIRNRTSKSVMPVELAQRLLGERSFRFSDTDVAKLAERHKIKKIIYLYINQQYRGYPKTKLAIVADTVDKGLQVKLFDIAAKSKIITFELAVMDVTPEIVSQLFGDNMERKSNKVEHFSIPPRLPETIIELAEGEKSPLQQAINLQLLGMLVPKNSRYERRRFFERSLIALRSVNPDSSAYNYLTSRAYFYLYRRPMALKQLGEPKTHEEKALHAYIKGNYPELKLMYEKIESPLFKLMAYFELSNLGEVYLITEELPLPIGIANKWMELAVSRTRDNDIWYAPDNTRFFRNLEGAFPEFDILYTDQIKSKAAIGDIRKYNYKLDTIFETAFLNYVNNNEESLCCYQGSSKVSKYDIALLYRTVGISNLLRKLNKYVNVQARYNASVDLYDAYESVFDGHGGLLRFKAEILDNKIDRASETEKMALIKDAYEQADMSYRLIGGTDQDAYIAFYIKRKYLQEYKNTFNHSNDRNILSMYSHDYPSSYSVGGSLKDPADIFRYTHTDFNLFERALNMLENKESESDVNITKEEMQADLKTRFNGHPGKIPFQARTLSRRGDVEGARRILTAAVENKAHIWTVYSQLGWFFIQDGQYDKAKEVFLKYPEFSKKIHNDPVTLSHHAFDAGSMLFWRGAAEQSRVFYQFAADLDTGSGSSIAGAQRVAILDRDFLTATQISLHAAQRYNSIYRYRDYLEMMHVYGLHERAEAGFVELAPRFETPQLWSGKFIGQRIQHTSLNEFIDWIYDYKKTAHDKLLAQIDRFTLTQSVVDRKLTTDNLPAINKVIALRGIQDNFKKGFNSASKLIKYLDSEPGMDITEVVINQDFPPAGDSKDYPAAPPVEQEIKSVPSKYSLFIDAYTHLKNNNILLAYERFKQYAMFYNIGTPDYKMDTHVLPYMALTVKEANKLENFERYLKEEYRIKHNDTFDYRLANAIILAEKGDVDESLKNLDKSLSLRPHTNFRVTYTMYQMLEISEMLYKKTKDQRYITKALKWANYYQKIQPHVSWTYAFEAKYGKNTKDRIEAIAYTLYLDPQSYWLQSAPTKYHVRAKKWWIKNNPFILPKQKQTKKTKT
ncbi:hypothetical protein MNBD_GAMMA21-3064 [hydrothermal vent metagenome]|uniref:Uncharacterized protein n=1 Tax=hydrothermal vent metagenome TaxID=652676 RepID=A0A3B1A5T0_9ZZZZ